LLRSFSNSISPPKIIIAGKPAIKPIKQTPTSISLKYKKGLNGEILIDGEFGGNGNFTNYNTEQGLPLSSISSSYVDHVGNLWFGTSGAGVCRFDGKSFITYTTEQGLANNNILSILEDRAGNLWFGTNGGGVSCYNGRFFKTYSTENGLGYNNIYSICQDKKGNIWFGADEAGVSRFDGKTFTIYSTSQGVPSGLVWSLLNDKNDNIWIGTDNEGLCRFDGKSFITYTKKDGLASNSVYKLYEDKKENIWISNGYGNISRYDGISFSIYTTADGLPGNVVNCMLEDKNGKMWFGTGGGGLCFFNGKSFITYTVDQGLVNNEITTINEDNIGNLWLGTNGSGICRFDGNSIINYTSQHCLANSCIWSIIEDEYGELWFGTYERGLSRFDSKSFLNFSKSNTIISYDIACIVQDDKKNMWFGTFGGGLCYYDGKKIKEYTTEQGLSNNFISYILPDKKGNLWLGTYGGGINYFDGKNFTIYDDKQGLSHNYINAIYEDKKGKIWIATDGGGINCFNYKRGAKDSYFTTYTKKDGLSHNSVHCFLTDKAGNFWMGTANGLCRFDGKSFITYTVVQGLSDNFVTQLLQDSSGRIFIGTNWGITVLKGWKGNNPVFEIYNKRTGFPIKDVNIGQQALYLDSKGIVWVGTGDHKTALVRFDYNSVNRNPNPLKLVIQSIKINEENLCWYSIAEANLKSDSTTVSQQEIMTFGKVLSQQERKAQKTHFNGIHFDSIMAYYPIPYNLVLPYEHNHITIEFAAIEPSKPTQVKYQYFLEGYDETWSPMTNKTNAVYGNIGEGTYKFVLKALSPDGVWSQPIYYTFKVLPPWYRSLWAYIIYAAVFFIILYVGIKAYTKRLLKEKILLEEIVKKRTLEISFQKEEIQNKVLVLNQEIETRKKAEELLLERESQLKNLNATKDKLFSIIAHDLRSPFSGILGFIELLQSTIRNQAMDKSEELLEYIYSATKNSYNLLETLLDWAKTQTNQVILNQKKLDISELIENSILELRSVALNKDIELINTISVKIYVFADENMINTILRNLISNSIKYTNSGGKITVSAQIKKEYLELSIADNGIGMSEELINTLFTSSVNQSKFGTNNEGGTGLGLIICKEFVEKQGGKIWVESEEKNGSNFKFSLPLFNETN